MCKSSRSPTNVLSRLLPGCLVLAGLAAALPATSPTQAATPRDWQECTTREPIVVSAGLGNMSDAEEIAEACTRVLDDAATPPGDRITAYVRRCYLREGRDRIADCNKAIELDPRNAIAHYHRGLARADQIPRIGPFDHDRSPAPKVNNADRIMADFAEAIRLNPRFAKVYHERAHLFFNLGDLDRAIVDLTEAINLDPKSGTAYEDRSTLLRYKGDIERAVADYTQAVKLSSTIAGENFERRTHPDFDKPAPDPAIAHYTAAITRNPADAIAYRNRGLAWSDKRNLDRAIADFTEAIKLDPKLIIAYRDRATAWFEKGDLDRAIADHGAAMRADPNGKLLPESREATDFVERVHMYPGSGDPYHQRAAKRATKGDLDGAIADWTAAIKIEPRATLYYRDRARTLDQKGDLDRAIADYTEAIKLEERKHAGYEYFARGGVWHKKGDLDRAIADYGEAIQIHATGHRSFSAASPFIHRGIAWSQKGDRARALADYANANAHAPKEIPELRTTGYRLFNQGDFKRAAHSFHPTADLDDRVQHILFHYLALSRAGEKAESRLEANAARAKNREWAHAIVELYLGRRSADATIGSATNADDRCEAQFHVGQWHLLRGRRAEAKAALQIAADTCRKDFVEYSAAVAELTRLSP